MAQKWSYKIKDNSNHVKGSGLYVSDLAASGDTIIYTTIENFESTLAAITTGNIVKSTLAVNRSVGADVPSPDVNSQNEIVLMVKYVDTVTNKKYYFTVPSPDPAMRATNTDLVDTTNAVWTAAVATWEAGGVSELGNPIVILGATFEGVSTS